MNKYHQTLSRILNTGKEQQNKKGAIRYLLNVCLTLTPADLLDIFETHGIARKKLRQELRLFMQGERNVDRYREVGITWWDYCGQTLVNSYPTYFEKLPPLIEKINREKRTSKNYVLFLGSTGAKYKNVPNVVFLIDPPYLSTEVGTYTMNWGLSDYLDVLQTLVGTNYIYFTSNKSSIIELCDWIDRNNNIGNPFAGCERVEFNAHMNYNSSYTDIMLFKKEDETGYKKAS